MKFILKEARLNEVKGTEEFRYDKAFIDSLMKPGKVTLVRFSNETGAGSDTVLLATNYSSYGSTHTPVAIYGYPLNVPEVLNDLRMQKLHFGNSDVIVVYWVDESSVFNLSKDMTRSVFDDLLDKIKSIKGEDFIKKGIEKAAEREAPRLRNMGRSSFSNIYSNLNLDTITDPLMMSRVFWNIVSSGCKDAKDMTLLLYKLGFKSITDESAIIDPTYGPRAVSQAPAQTLTLNKAFTSGFKIYTNPSRQRTSSRKPGNWKSLDPKKTEEESIRRFTQGMEEYKKQLPRLASTLDDKMKVEHVSGRTFKMTIRMPTTIRSAPRFKQQKDPKGNAEYNLLEDLKSADGRSYGDSNSGMDFYSTNLILEPRKPDLLEVIFHIPPGLIDRHRPYKFLGFMYRYFTARDSVVTNKESYLYMV